MNAGATFLKAAGRKLVDFALPPRCPSCGVIVEGDDRFCLPCWASLDFIGPPWCESCNLPLGDSALAGDICANCMVALPPFDGVRAVVAYSRQSASIILKLKYGRRTGVARLIARHLERHLPEGRDDWLLVPVPLHSARLWQRGFNQSLLIARHLGRKSGIAVATDLLVRTRRTRPLKGMGPKQRDAEVKSVFAVAPNRSAEIKGRKIILVDDVLTSGATARACAKRLKRAGASEVVIFCWARVLPAGRALDLGLSDSDIADI